MWLNSTNTSEPKKCYLRHFIYIAAMIWRVKNIHKQSESESEFLSHSHAHPCTLNIPFNFSHNYT